MNRRFFCLLLLALSPASVALEVRDTLWGFNGQVTPGTFNLLSVLVENSSAVAFDGELVMTEGRLGGRVGPLYAQPIFVAPFTGRWVQFYPFLNREGEWSLSWGKRNGESIDLPAPKFAAPARVLFTDPGDSLARGGKFKSFPENLFPPTVAATDGLASVVLDHAPRWEPAKREAFLDWVRRGGTLHVLRGEDGKYPAFADDLAVLNAESARNRLGAGLVKRHAFTRRDANDAKLEEPLPELKTGKNVTIYSLESGFFQMLASLTRPDLDWTTIYVMAFAYLGVLGPGHFFWARRRKSRTGIIILVGAVAAFGAAFGLVGRRGYGETAKVHSLAWARALGEGRYDVMDWDNAFVTRGDFYKLSHAATHNLYATSEDNDPVNGHVQSGKDGVFSVDIPLFSSRVFVHRAVMTGDDTAVRVLKWKTVENKPKANLKTLTLALPAKFPTPVEVWARHRNTFHAMEVKNGQLVLTGSDKTASDFFSDLNLATLAYANRVRDDKQPDRDAALRKSLPALIARATGGADKIQRSVEMPPLPDDGVQLFVFAPSPESFRVRGKSFDKQTGFVLYDQVIFKPSATP